MALVVFDRVKESSNTAGTGTIVLAGAQAGYQSFAVVGNANTTYYTIADQSGSNWEVGIGTYYSGNVSLARTTILASSNANAAVSFGSNTKDVFITYPAEKSVNQDATGNVTVSQFLTANILYLLEIPQLVLMLVLFLLALLVIQILVFLLLTLTPLIPTYKLLLRT